MNDRPANPPAFPHLREHVEQNKNEENGAPWRWYVGEDGMSMRDFFAAAALTGMLARPDIDGLWGEYADRAYGAADAMLRRRNF